MAAVESVKDIPWWKEPTKEQWYAWWAAWLGWTLDAFDFTVFLLIMVPISQEFGVPLSEVAFVLTITLWMRLIGAVASGWLADRVGRKIPLMISILADITIPADLPRIARDIYGSGVARRGGLGDGELADPLARFHERGPAGVVGDRLCALELNLGPLCRLYWLARHVVDWRIAGAFGVLCAPVCQGARGLGREPAAATCSEP